MWRCEKCGINWADSVNKCLECLQEKPTESESEHNKGAGEACLIDFNSSGMCNRGTKGCIAIHESLYTIEQVVERLEKKGIFFITKDRVKVSVQYGDKSISGALTRAEVLALLTEKQEKR